MSFVNKIREKDNFKKYFDYLVTFGSEFLIMVITVALFKLVGQYFNSLSFAEYTISKRLNSFLIPLLFIGMGVSLPKYLATSDKKGQIEIIYTALIIITTFFLFGVLVFTLFSGAFSQLVFGDDLHGNILLINLLLVYALMLHGCIYNYFRGSFKFIFSSFLQLTNLAILPLITFFFTSNTFDYLLLLSSLNILFCLVIGLIYIPKLPISISEIKLTLKKILSYGIQRMPGDVLLGLYFAIPTFIISNYVSIISAGAIAFCMSLFNIIIAFMSPINIILLPKASKIVEDKDYVLLKSISTKLLFVSIVVGVVSLLAVLFFGLQILDLFNVENSAEVSTYLTIIFSSVVGFSLFSVIRSIIDAFYVKARNTINISISFVLFIGIALIMLQQDILSIKNILIAFSVTINILGLLTYYSMLKIFKKFAE